MSPKLVITGLIALVVTAYLSWRMCATLGLPFAFSIPLHDGRQEIGARLPAGRYALVITTNSNLRALSVIPPVRDYRSQLTLEIKRGSKVLVRATNSHHLVLPIDAHDAGEVSVQIGLEPAIPKEALTLHISKGF
jgi:hypothetical protein